MGQVASAAAVLAPRREVKERTAQQKFDAKKVAKEAARVGRRYRTAMAAAAPELDAAALQRVLDGKMAAAMQRAEDEVRGARVGREGRLSSSEAKEVAMKVIRMLDAKTKRLQGRKRRREGREARRHGGELRASHES